MKSIALETIRGDDAVTIAGVSDTGDTLWLPVSDDLGVATCTALTLLAQGERNVAADVAAELRDDPQHFFVPSRFKLRRRVAAAESFPELRRQARGLTRPASLGLHSDGGSGKVFADASVMSSGCALGWVCPTGGGEVRLGVAGTPVHLLEMEAIVLAVEGTTGTTHVFSDCASALGLLSGSSRPKMWRDEVADFRRRLKVARKGRCVGMSWVRSHSVDPMNIRVDTLVRAAALCGTAC